MRNILFVLSLCVFLLLCCWFMLGLVGSDPPDIIQTYFGVSHDIADWIFLEFSRQPARVPAGPPRRQLETQNSRGLLTEMLAGRFRIRTMRLLAIRRRRSSQFHSRSI